MDENACRNAAVEQGYNYQYSPFTSYMPYGCVESNGNVFFNQGNYGRNCGYNGYNCLCTSNCGKCPSGTIGNGVDCMPLIATCDVGYGVDIEKITSGTCGNANRKNLTIAECKLLADASNKNFYTMSGEQWRPVGCFDYGAHIAFNTENRWGSHSGSCGHNSACYCKRDACKKCIAPMTSTGGPNAKCRAPFCPGGYGTGYEILTSGTCKFEVTSQEECFMAHKWLGSSDDENDTDRRRLFDAASSPMNGCVRYAWGGASYSLKENLASHRDQECGKDGLVLTNF